MIQVFSPKEFQSYIENLPNKIKQSNGELQKTMAMSLAQRIRMRAPEGQTGSLKHQIKAQLGKNGWRIIGPGHWSFVNAGVHPDHMIPIEFLEAHLGNPGSTAGKTANIVNPKAWFQPDFTEGQGFVDRALTSFDKDSVEIIEKGIMRALSK